MARRLYDVLSVSLPMIFRVLESLVNDVFLLTLDDLLTRAILSMTDFPVLKDVLQSILTNLRTLFPTLSTSSFFEFCCATALLMTLLISFVKWLVGIIK